MKVNRNQGVKWSYLAVNNKLDELKADIMRAVVKDIELNGREYHPNSWTAHALNFVRSTLKQQPEAYFNIFNEGGNSKLPFLSYSTLPGVNCPGAGACLSEGYCYSFKAWRYPAAYFRQLQNTILERQRPELIASELKRIINKKAYSGRRVDLRLYVDGDFPNLDIMRFWFNTLEALPRVAAYGYSKSIHLFIDYIKLYKVPGNYALNGSGGGLYDSRIKEIQNEAFYRGNFESYQLDSNKSATKLTRDEKQQIRKAYNEKIFICPGLCGNCTSAGHACGSLDKFKNIKIVTPIH